MSSRPFTVMIVDTTTTFGGAFEIAVDLCKAINRVEGHAAHMISSQPRELLDARLKGVIPYLHLSGRPWKMNREGSRTKALNVAGNVALREVPMAYKLARYARRHGCSVFHLNNNLNSQMFAAAISRSVGARCVCSYRGYAHPSRLLRALESRVDRHIACSRPIRDHLVNVMGVPEDKIAYLYDPVDTERYSPDATPVDLAAEFGVPPGRKVFAIFGRLVPWKGHEVFLKAARLVVDAVPEAHAMIVGDVSDGNPSYGDRLRALAGELGIADRTTFTGFRADVPQMMRAADVLVHASTEPEPFGTAVLEGMACGRPYVAMDEGGPAEMITSGVHGLLVRPNAPEAMAEALITLLTRPEIADEFGRAARASCVERFSAPTIARQYLELYHEVAERP